MIKYNIQADLISNNLKLLSWVHGNKKKESKIMARRIRKGRVITAAALTIALATTGIISLKRNTDNSPNSYATANETNEVKMTT